MTPSSRPRLTTSLAPLCRFRAEGPGARRARASNRSSSLSGPSRPARSATVSATRLTLCRPLAERRPSRSLRSSTLLAPGLKAATSSSCHAGNSAFTLTPRTSARRRAALTLAATSHVASIPGAPAERRGPLARRSSTSGRCTRTRRSNRSSRGPEIRAAYRARAASLQAHAPGEPSAPQRQAFMAATSMNCAGKATAALALQTTTRPSSSGWRRLSSTARGNSANSSRKRTPRCAQLISPGRSLAPPPPISDTAEAL